MPSAIEWAPILPPGWAQEQRRAAPPRLVRVEPVAPQGKAAAKRSPASVAGVMAALKAASGGFSSPGWRKAAQDHLAAGDLEEWGREQCRIASYWSGRAAMASELAEKAAGRGGGWHQWDEAAGVYVLLSLHEQNRLDGLAGWTERGTLTLNPKEWAKPEPPVKVYRETYRRTP